MDEKDFISFLETFSALEGLQVINSELPYWIQFYCFSQDIMDDLLSQIEDTNCKILPLPDKENPQEIYYKLTFENDFSLLFKRLKNYLDSGNYRTAKLNELGIPDLSMVTIRQMAVELKQRKNICFALMWMEDNERDNIAIEGSGNPTQLVGLISRGLHMAIEWSDKNIKFQRPNDE